MRREYLEDVGRALGIPDATLLGMPTKDDVLSLVVQRATGQPMDPALFSPGATVTNEALQVIIDGLLRRGLPNRDVPVVEPRTLAEDLFEFDPVAVADERDLRLVEIAAREGQDRFRTALLDAYDARCAITGTSAVEVLQAAHIFPYQGPATNHITNGLLLRADIHILYDRGAIAVHETTHQVLVKEHLTPTEYAALAGSRLRLPRAREHRPATAALRSHREWAGL